MVSLPQFQNFFYAKAFDIIGNNTFKKHLAKCKEANDAWAIEMCADINSVQSLLRDTQQIVQEAASSGVNKIFVISKDVMNSAQPPIKLYTGVVTCEITNQKCTQCLDFSKIQKNFRSLYIDARFSQFFLLLWYLNKIEYIIRSYVRHWLETNQATVKELNFRGVCDLIQTVFPEKIQVMHKLFNLSYQHVSASLALLQQNQMHRVILNE